MNDCTEWNFGEQKRISNFRCNTFTGDYFLIHLETLRSNNITLLTIFVEDKSDTSRTIWIVFDGLHCSFDAIFIAFEID
jgi:hypothetical protein